MADKTFSEFQKVIRPVFSDLGLHPIADVKVLDTFLEKFFTNNALGELIYKGFEHIKLIDGYLGDNQENKDNFKKYLYLRVFCETYSQAIASSIVTNAKPQDLIKFIEDVCKFYNLNEISNKSAYFNLQNVKNVVCLHALRKVNKDRSLDFGMSKKHTSMLDLTPDNFQLILNFTKEQEVKEYIARCDNNEIISLFRKNHKAFSSMNVRLQKLIFAGRSNVKVVRSETPQGVVWNVADPKETNFFVTTTMIDLYKTFSTDIVKCEISGDIIQHMSNRYFIQLLKDKKGSMLLTNTFANKYNDYFAYMFDDLINLQKELKLCTKQMAKYKFVVKLDPTNFRTLLIGVVSK